MSKKEKTKQEKRQWVVTVVILSFVLSVLMSVLTSLFVDSAGLLVALLALIVLISIGVITDVIGPGGHVGGRAAVYCDGLPSGSRARSGRLRLIRKAERVSSLLNDVVGDIVGVISGSAGSVIALYLAAMGLPTAVASVLIAAFTSAFMIGGKAAGESIAIEQSANIVLFVGKTMALFERKTTKRKKNKKN